MASKPPVIGAKPLDYVKKTFSLPFSVAERLESYGSRKKSAVVSAILAKHFKIKLDRW